MPGNFEADDVPPDAIRAQLQRMLANKNFTRAQRISKLLWFLVEEALAGRGDDLKGSYIARSIYDRPKDFKSADDPVVRGDVKRLREKLRNYYDEASEDEVEIALPKTTCHPEFRW
jgi:hypothetical protein